MAAALRDNEWASACGPLKTCAGSLFGEAARLADVCSAGAALGEAGLEIDDASLVDYFTLLAPRSEGGG